MKECEWCGIDFRGPFVSVEEHFFCSDTCAEDWRRDEYGDDVVDAEKEAAAKAEEGTDPEGSDHSEENAGDDEEKIGGEGA